VKVLFFLVYSGVICKIKAMKVILALFILFFLTVSCERKPSETAEQAMRQAPIPPSLVDDLPLDGLLKGIKDNTSRLRRSKVSSLTFGPKDIPREDYILSLNYLAGKIHSGISKEEFYEIVYSNFDFYEVYGSKEWGEVFITSYYEPVLQGSKRQNSKHTQPIYATPDDLVNIHLKKYAKQLRKLKPIKEQIINPKYNLSILAGRIAPSYHKGTSKNIVPYYTRKEIDAQKVLEKKATKLAWVDPVDAFFLQIQGSGAVRFSNGEEIRLGYAAQNGRRYVGIGRLVYDKIPKDKLTAHNLKGYLRSLPEKEMNKILYQNPSYIFFRKIKGRPITHFGTEVVDGRTIATDRRFYPKGALAYMEFPTPVFPNKLSEVPSEWNDTSRFVLDQDTGGAIKGPHRVDLFWGRGEEAGQHAGVLKHWGKLYYMVPKDEFIKKLRGD